MAATTLTPMEVYLRTSYRPDADYVDGVVEKRNLGQNDHSAHIPGSRCRFNLDEIEKLVD